MSAEPGKDAETAKAVTVECSAPGERYTLFESGPALVVHLAGRTQSGGTGPCICEFDRFADGIGFSVGGGTRGPSIRHEVCGDCARLNDGRPVDGMHAPLFAALAMLP